jgi:hypothetical protein
MSERSSAAELLARGIGFLDSGHFRELGLSERAIEAVWRDCPTVRLPSFDRPLVPVEAYLAFIADHTYCDRCADKVHPSRGRRRA